MHNEPVFANFAVLNVQPRFSVVLPTPINLFYIARKLQGREMALRAVNKLLATLPVAAVNQLVLQSGLALGFHDFEDAVQYASADANSLEAIVTRNVGDYGKAQLPVFSPADFIEDHRELFEKLALDSD